MNPITEKIYYTVDVAGTPLNQRMVVSAPLEKPIVWEISKIEPTGPLGLQRVTLKQDKWNPETDYIDKDDVDDKFAMYANYFINGISPDGDDKALCKVHCASNTIKCGGSYRTFTASVFNSHEKDVTSDIENIKWAITMDDTDMVESGLVNVIGDGTKIKIKFLGDRSYLTKVMHVQFSCTYKDKAMTGSIDMTIVAM